MTVNEGKVNRETQRAAAEAHLKAIGMPRYGWLHKDLQVALHTARNEGKITDKKLKALGDLLKQTTAERMKPHLTLANEIAKGVSGDAAFDHLMYAVNLVLSAPLEAKRLVIKHEDLHSEVKQKVNELLAARQKRITGMLPFEVAVSMPVAAIIGGTFGPFAFKSIEKGMPLGAALATLPSASAMAAQYKAGSPAVREATGRIIKKGKTAFLDWRNTISVAHARETHPFLIVDRKGNVHLIPKTKYQTALAKAQQTFLKHVVPGRYRAKL